MELVNASNLHYHHRLVVLLPHSSSSRSIIVVHHRRPSSAHNNVRSATMLLARKISTRRPIIIADLIRQKHLALKQSSCAFNIMAEPTKQVEPKKNQEEKDDEIVKGEIEEAPSRREEEQRPPPSPPEKPLAGDCCGSGCVRCVWDVYYEELEEYNKLYGGSSSK